MKVQNTLLLFVSVSFAALMGRRTVKTVGVYFEPKSFMKLKLVGDEFKKINLYENLTPNSDPIALLQQTETERVFLEDPFRMAPDYLRYAEAIEFDWNRFFTRNKYTAYPDFHATNAPLKSLSPNIFESVQFEKKLAFLAAHNVDIDANFTDQNCWPEAVNPLEATLLNRITFPEYRTETVEILLSRGADVNLLSSYGECPLHRVVKCSSAPQTDLSVLKMLIDFGANVDALDSKGFTPLMCAVDYKLWEAANPRCVEILLDAGARIDARDPNGLTPLLHAICSNYTDCIKILLNRGANVNAPDSKGNFPLHVAVRGNEPSVVEILFDFGADINARCEIGLTPLMWAVYYDRYRCEYGNPRLFLWPIPYDYTECIKVLIKCGADVFLKSGNHGKAAFDMMDQNRKNLQFKIALEDAMIKVQRREDAYVKNWFLVALALPFLCATRLVWFLIFSVTLLAIIPLTGFNKTCEVITDAFLGMCSDFSHEISRIMKSKRPY